jgi:hypothetical protein
MLVSLDSAHAVLAVKSHFDDADDRCVVLI